MDKNDTNCLSSSKAHQHHQRFCQSLSASSGHWMVGRDGRCTSFSQCAFVHLCYRGGNQIRIRWSEQVPFWVRPLPRPLPGLSLGHRVGWGVAPVAAHAAARPPGLPQMLLAFKELWSSAWKSWNYIYICIYMCICIYVYIYILSLRVEIPEIYVQTLEFDSPSFFCSFRCPCRFCSHSQAQSTNGIRGANLCTCSVANVVSEIYWHLVFVCLEEVWQHFVHQPWRQQKTKLLIILKYNLI